MSSADFTIKACTVSSGIEHFGTVIDTMDSVYGENWGDLAPHEVTAFLNQDNARTTEALVFVVSEDDERHMGTLRTAIAAAQEHGCRVVVVTEDLDDDSLRALDAPVALALPLSQDDLVQALTPQDTDAPAEPEQPIAAQEPPLPDAPADEADAAPEATPEPNPNPEPEPAPAPEPASEPEPAPAPDPTPEPAPTVAPAPAAAPLRAPAKGTGILVAVHGLSGGIGATTLAANLAYELAHQKKAAPVRVCLMDFDLQFGGIANALEVEQRPAVTELLTNLDTLDAAGLMQALRPRGDQLFVLTAPADLVPLDIVSAEDVQRLIDLARSQFDYVIVDMPRTVVDWTETVLRSAQLYFAPLEADLRSAQNCVRFRNALRSEEMPTEHLRFVLNRAPKGTDLGGRGRVKRMSEALGISIDVQLPDGGKQVVQAADDGTALAESSPKAPLRKEIVKLAQDIHDFAQSYAE